MEKSIFVEKIDSFIKKERLFKPHGRYLAAVSGGADSVVMLRVMLQLGIECEVAHCNFHLRGEESVRDEKFVENLCRDLSVKYHKIDFDVESYVRQNHVSEEMACRDLRYDWFASLVDSLGLYGVIVAHHSDDNAETLFLNLLRGTGIAGLTGMQPSSFNRVRILRPLLCVSRSDIENYARELGQDFIIDSTNHENVVKRNKLRNIVIPTLRDLFPDADSAIASTIANLRGCNRLYQHEIDRLRQTHVRTAGDITEILLPQFFDEYSAAECADTLLFELLRPFGFNSAQVADIIDAYTTAHSGAEFAAGKHTATLSHGILYIEPHNSGCDSDCEYPISLSQDISEPIRISVEHISDKPFSPRCVDGKKAVCFSTEILNATLTLRHWRKGDRFRPFGMKGSRLVSDLFSDLKLSDVEKRQTWLLTADGDIVWIVGLRSSAQFSISRGDSAYIVLKVSSDR